ncbi:MAG TPA: MFS transporter [Gemmatales bacterium]|nr:MFS transporter [Gemmatales bacterium]
MQPTLVRYRILGLMCSLAMITYLDRALNGNAKKPIMEAVGYEEKDYYLLLVAFQLAYALFEIPTGWLGDMYGPRKTLLRVVLFWSFFLGLIAFAGLPLLGTPISIGFWSLVVIQFLFGAGEAGAFPNISKALYQWFPATERAFVQGTVWFSSRLMGGLTTFVWILFTVGFGLDWRVTVGIFAGLGIVWAIFFYISFRNKPSDHPDINQAEVDLIAIGKKPAQDSHAGVPWRHLFSQPNLWYLCGMYFCMNYGWYFLMYFLPTYMKQAFNIQPDTSLGYQLLVALLTGSPLLLGGIACVWGGVLSDRYIKATGNRTWGRKLFGILGYAGCAMAYLAAIFLQANPYLLITCLALVGFFNDLTMGPAWATAQDIGRRYAAIISGSMNMIGNLGAAISNYVTGVIIFRATTDGKVASYGYMTCLTMYAVAYGIGVIFWYLTDANKPLADD